MSYQQVTNIPARLPKWETSTGCTTYTTGHTVAPADARAMWQEHAALGYRPMQIVRKLAMAGFTVWEILEAAPNE